MRPSIRSLPKSISLFRRLLRARAGNATLLMAFGAPALIATAGFAVDTNRVVFVTAQGVEALPLMSKAEVAARIVAWVVERLNAG